MMTIHKTKGRGAGKVKAGESIIIEVGENLDRSIIILLENLGPEVLSHILIFKIGQLQFLGTLCQTSQID